MIKDLFEIFIAVKRDVHLQDFADSLASTVTVFMLFVFSSLVTYKTYFRTPMECFSTNAPSGLNFENYVTSYCWVSGTTALGPNDVTPTNKEWDDPNLKQISYYPWIPIILGIQCILFLLPKHFWKEFCSYKSGTDLQNIMKSATEASEAPVSTRQELYKNIACIIEVLFHLHRDNRKGLFADVKRKMYQKFPLLIWGKRSGNCLFGVYLGTKILYLGVAVGQFILMTKMLQLDNSFWYIFIDVWCHIFLGHDWKATKFFPRKTYCDVKNVRAPGSMDNRYTAQCILPINILNEKIYIFLFMWMGFLILIMLIYLFKWIYLVAFRAPKRNLIKVYLKGRNVFKKMEETKIDKFISEFIRLDGIFLMVMIRLNAGDVVAAGIVEELWKIYSSHYKDLNFANSESPDQMENLALRLEPGEKKASMKTKNNSPSAPCKDMFL